MSTGETVSVATTDDGFVEITHDKWQFGVQVGGTFRCEAGSLGWLVSTMRDVVANETPVESSEQRGGDDLVIKIGGPEQAPVLNLINHRSDDKGPSSVSLPWPLAEQALSALEALV